jgi:hypothetical protein
VDTVANAASPSVALGRTTLFVEAVAPTLRVPETGARPELTASSLTSSPMVGEPEAALAAELCECASSADGEAAPLPALRFEARSTASAAAAICRRALLISLFPPLTSVLETGGAAGVRREGDDKGRLPPAIFF